jgi:hypothetical protein
VYVVVDILTAHLIELPTTFFCCCLPKQQEIWGRATSHAKSAHHHSRAPSPASSSPPRMSGLKTANFRRQHVATDTFLLCARRTRKANCSTAMLVDIQEVQQDRPPPPGLCESYAGLFLKQRSVCVLGVCELCAARRMHGKSVKGRDVCGLSRF